MTETVVKNANVLASLPGFEQIPPKEIMSFAQARHLTPKLLVALLRFLYDGRMGISVNLEVEMFDANIFERIRPQLNQLDVRFDWFVWVAQVDTVAKTDVNVILYHRVKAQFIVFTSLPPPLLQSTTTTTTTTTKKKEHHL